MARTLWLLRHAQAVNNPPPGGRDRDRRLSPRGEKQVVDLAEIVEGGGLGLGSPALILTSPATRTRATAEGVFARRGGDVAVATDRRLYQATPDDLLDIIHEVPEEITSLGVVGHNPTIHCLVIDLVEVARPGGLAPPSRSYPPATLSVIEFDVASWEEISWSSGSLRILETPAEQ